MMANRARSCRSIAVVLWLAWAMMLAVALCARVVDNDRLSSIETALKASSSAVLVAAAWFLATTSPPPVHRIAVLIAIGMTLGCSGDASPLLGHLWPDPQRTLTNMVLFGIGHVAYISACAHLRRLDERTHRCVVFWGAIVLWLFIGTVAWYQAAWIGPYHDVMKMPALAYTLLLATTVGVTSGLALQNLRYVPMAVGSVLFLVSDLLLAIWIFHDRFYSPFDLVWLTYGVGQMLIVYGSTWAMMKAAPSVEGSAFRR